MTKLPKTLFVTVGEEGTADECLLCWKDIEETAQIGEKIRVGKYQLVETLEVTAKVEGVRK